jgi:putative ABC transport system permease protein
MWTEWMCRLAAVLCFLSMIACVGPGPDAASDNPPATNFRVASLTLSSDGISQTIRGVSVTPAFFQMTRAQPLVGRLFVPQEYQSGGRQVVVLCHQFWQKKFGADPGVIGKSLGLNGHEFTIVGVMPSTFEVPSGVDLWLPKAEPAN